MTSKEQQQLNNEVELLKCNITTMCLAANLGDIEELEKWAHQRIDSISELNKDRVRER